MSWFGIVLLHSSEVLMEGHFSYVKQGGGVGCTVEVLAGF